MKQRLGGTALLVVGLGLLSVPVGFAFLSPQQLRDLGISVSESVEFGGRSVRSTRHEVTDPKEKKQAIGAFAAIPGVIGYACILTGLLYCFDDGSGTLGVRGPIVATAVYAALVVALHLRFEVDPLALLFVYAFGLTLLLVCFSAAWARRPSRGGRSSGDFRPPGPA